MQKNTRLGRIDRSPSSSICFVVGLLFCSALFADNGDTLDCLVKPEMYVELSSPVDGVLETILVGKSDVVKKGQELARLESAIEAATVELARQKASVEDDINSKMIRLAFAKRKLARLEKLYKKKVLSFYDKDEAETEAAIAGMELEKAKSDKKIAELELRRALIQLAQKTVRSPIDGVVMERFLAPGESVDDRPILKLAQLDPLRVEVIAPGELFGTVTKGMQAEIVPEFPKNAVYKATVSVVDKVIDEASGSFVVRLALPNPDHNVLGGIRCKVHFLANHATPNKTKQLTATDRGASNVKTVFNPANIADSLKALN